jgi:Mg-chelatase subunit ChlD
MRTVIRRYAGERLAAVVGSFHSTALLDAATHHADPETDVDDAPVVTSLVPYPYALLDARSGYPAGIRDPLWQQGVFEAAGAPEAIDALATALAVRVTQALRAAGHPAGPAESTELVRVARDLARLRDLPAPGRGEFIEAVGAVLGHGDVHGRGRAIAAALHAVLIGDGAGSLAAGTPASGLVPAVIALLAELGLPGPGDKSRILRLDPLRSPLDRRREVTLAQLAVCGVPYATPWTGTAAGGIQTLTTSWLAEWQLATEPTLALAGLHGVTLEQAAAGMLRADRSREQARGGSTPAQVLAGLGRAAAAGVPDVVELRLADIGHIVVDSGTLAEIIDAITLVEQLAAGHSAGVPEPPPTCADMIEMLDAAAVRDIAGLAGSDRIEDARALVAIAGRAGDSGRRLRLINAIEELALSGAPLMQGAAVGVLALCGDLDHAAAGGRVASWIDAGGEPLRQRIAGALIAADGLVSADGAFAAPVIARVEGHSDADFTVRLPALRGGFDVLSTAARERMRTALEDRLGRIHPVDDPEALVRWLGYDQAGHEVVERAFADAAVLLPPVARWRLVLGRPDTNRPAAATRAASALDELYGHGHGEGSRELGGDTGTDTGTGGGREAPQPTTRDWADELADIFGTEVCQQILGEAARRGRTDVLDALDPATVRPSVDLLHTVLSLAGGLPEAQLQRLRPLVARVVADLTKRLATRLRPALTGITTPRPSRRRTGTLDLRATIAANLHTATIDAQGRARITPERLRFRTRGRRGVDWQLILVVDVSGSMEASTVWAALTAAILAGVPAVRTRFITFSTSVIDLSEHVDDPLSLLLEVSVGGGTHIAAGLRYARDLITVPARTMVVVVSDFEEGYPIGDLLGEARALVDSGARLIGCASLDDKAQPRYSVGIAQQLVNVGMPVAALSPLALAQWVAEQVR